MSELASDLSKPAPTVTAAMLARNVRRRRRGAAPPELPRGALLLLRSDVLADAPPAETAIRRAAELAGDSGVVIVQVLRLHGYAWGLPNPGLLPNRKERAAAETRVAAVIAALGLTGIDADAEILVTRHDGRGVARIATRRGVANVIIEQRTYGALRTFVEGDLARALRRRLGAAVAVEIVEAP